MKDKLKDRMTGLGRILILSILVLCPLGYIHSQEAENPVDDETIAEGYKVIKDAQGGNQEPQAESDTNVDVGSPAQEEGQGKVSDEAPDKTPDKPDTTEVAPPDGRTDSLSAKEAPRYDSAGKRDPFKPFLKLIDIPVGPSPVVRPPIQRYPLNQFRIVGIVWIGNQPQAMVVDPEANTYFLGVGDKIGDKEGEILEVRESGLLVQETARLENVYGEVKVEVRKSVLAFQDEE